MSKILENTKLLETVRQFHHEGKMLIPLDGKTPIAADWTTKTLDIEYVKSKVAQGFNAGWAIDDKHLVIDVDVKNGGAESLEKLKSVFSIAKTRTVSTPSGGAHYYFKLPEQYHGKKFRKVITGIYDGIDFLTKGSQCGIAGNKVSNGEYKWVENVPENHICNELLDFLEVRNEIEGQEHLGDFKGLLSDSFIREEDVCGLLDDLDPSMGYDEWVKVGMALHNWDPIRGLELWEHWSKSGKNYESNVTNRKWDSFSTNDGITLGTLYYMSKTAKFNKKNKAIEIYITKIKNATKSDLEISIIPSIKKEDFNHINKEVLVKVIQDRFKELDGVKIPIGKIRDLVSTRGEYENETPEWCFDWVFVDSHNRYIDLKSMTMCRVESFNIKNTKYVPLGENGTKQTAAKYVAENGYIQAVDSVAYLPQEQNLITELDGSTILNIFNPKTVPKKANSYTDAGLEAIEKIKTHIEIIIGNKEYEQIFLEWIAYQIQHTGKKLLWAPVIQGTYGAGKSFFAELLRACLGQSNVGTISPTQISSQFNAWATNKVVNILEEIRVIGKNRHDILNALKPLITDPIIQVNDKNVSQFTTYNTANYICFTNYKDAIPIDLDDRRWWIIFSKLQSKADIDQIEKDKGKEYFNNLFGSIKQHKGEIRKWLLEFEISSEFLKMTRAPMTEHKIAMANLEDLKMEGFVELKNLVDKGGRYFNSSCVSSSDLFDQLFMDHPELEIHSSRRHQLLKKLGFVPHDRIVKIDGKTRRIWLKNSMSNDAIRAEFST